MGTLKIEKTSSPIPVELYTENGHDYCYVIKPPDVVWIRIYQANKKEFELLLKDLESGQKEFKHTPLYFELSQLSIRNALRKGLLPWRQSIEGGNVTLDLAVNSTPRVFCVESWSVVEASPRDDRFDFKIRANVVRVIDDYRNFY